MMSFGSAIRVTLFGSSHGPKVGASVEGIPAGVTIDLSEVQADLDRRRPVGRRLSTRRREEDRLVVDSGLSGDRTTGDPIRFHVVNQDVQRAPYEALRNRPRPGHADFPARVRFGSDADLSGGGIFSGRMTVGLVGAGALLKAWLRPRGIDAVAFARSIGGVGGPVPVDLPLDLLRARVRSNEVGAGATRRAPAMEAAILRARRSGDSVGGEIECRVTGLAVGIGEPFFDSVESEIAHLAFSIPAVKAIEFGAGFRVAHLRGSENNDPYGISDGKVVPRTNHAGGVLGGLTTGAPVVFRVAVKPTASIARPQSSVDLTTHEEVRIRVAGRHDPCIVPRAVVVVEAIAWIGLAELMMRGGYIR